jgi:uncharacterized protein with gpF-like domain
MAVEYRRTGFIEAIQFFRKKLDVTSEHWTDLWKEAHDTAFTVAGATKADLLADLRRSVDKAISEGKTIQDFRKEFDETVQKHGWQYKGNRGWRTRVIYETNLRTAYSAGRYAQMTDSDVQRARPYWQYRHGGSADPREQHLSWDGMVLPADDPWWNTHYPPNGWGCSCKVVALSESDLERMGKDGPDRAPETGTYQWTNPRTGEVKEVPEGVDPGWDYAPGKSIAERTREYAKQKTRQLPQALATALQGYLAKVGKQDPPPLGGE